MGILSTPVEVYYSFADVDAPLLEQMEKHLSVLQHEGQITTWHRREILAGTDWRVELDQHLNTASLILLLISPAFVASNYCYGVEMQRAMRRHEAGEARVIPLLLRPVDWQAAPFGKLKALPSNGMPVTVWSNRDEAFKEVVEEIKKVLEKLQKNKKTIPLSSSPLRDPFPAIWNVPYRFTPFFTGRESVIANLFTSFTTVPPTGIIPVQALTGLGGLGKTQTAVAYAFRYRKQYQTVLWIKAETEGDLIASFTNMAKLLALIPDTNIHHHESVLGRVGEWFSTAADWLLILDNADNLALVEPFLPTKLPNGHLLLTTRATVMDGLAQPLALTPLSLEEGALCLLRRTNYLGWNADLGDPSLSTVARRAALDLAELMGGLPLALEQAGAYIETTGGGITRYLKLYEHYRPEIQKNQYGTILYYRTAVAFAWNIAREVIQRENPAAIELLHLCAYLAPDAIPYGLFPKDPHILGPLLGPVAAHSFTLDKTLIPLRRHSLIKQEVDRNTDLPRIFIHRVLQEILRDGMDTEMQRLWAERAVRIVAYALSNVKEWSVMQAHVQTCLLLIEHWKMSFREADLIRQYIRPHIEEI